MKTLSSAHVHTTFCDGKTPAPEMARAAYEKGFVSLGFTSHAPQRFDPGYCIDPAMEGAYQDEIRALQREYAGRMAIYMGLERDLYSCASPAPYDYFIASVHYFELPDGHHAAIDGNPQDLKKYVDTYCQGDGLMMATRYFSMLRDYVLRDRPAIIGHYDLVRKNNAALRLYDEESPAYRRIALDTLRPLVDTGALLEVNTGAMARGYLSSPYPDAYLLREWKAWGGKVTVTSDCHDKTYLDAYFDEAEALLSSLGFDHAVRLGASALWEEYSLL